MSAVDGAQITYVHSPISRVLFPIFNGGTAAGIFITVVICLIVAFFIDDQMALYMAAGSYISVVIMSSMIEVYPAFILINGRYINRIEEVLDNEPNMVRLDGRMWAPVKWTSTLWKSDRITITDSTTEGYIRVFGRARDLRILLRLI
jgi:hypothetical protein